MKEKKTGEKKAGIYALVTLGITSIIISVLIIVGSIYIQSNIISGINKIYDKVESTYQESDDAVVKTQNFVDKVRTDFNKVAPLINILTDTDKKKITDTIDGISAKTDDIKKFLEDAKNSVAQTNDKIDMINSLGVVSLPKLTGDKIQSASDKVNDFSSELGTLKTDISNGQAKQTVVDKVNKNIDNTQNALASYRLKISDGKQNAKDFKDLVIFWSTLGTLFIVGFFVWSIYSFYYFTRGQVRKLRELKK
jgi:uncharacterized coiled-coil DUF342 family protein